MSTDVTKTESPSTPTQTAPVTIESPNLSFTDYERLRKGEKVEVVASDQSAPAGEGQKEQKTPSKSDAEETEAEKESETSEEDSSQQSEDEPKDEASDEKPKKKGGFQRRIDKLNAAKTAAQQEAEYWKRLALEGAGGTKKEAAKVDSTTTQTTTDGKPTPDSFETHAEYVEAIADWKAEQKFKERDQKEAEKRLQAEQGKRVQTYAEKAKAFSEKTDDFADVLAEVDDVPLSQAVREIILESENGPELAYELAKNREEYARVCALSPLQAAREMGKLEARIASKASEEKITKTTKTTKAPKPIEPVGGIKSAGANKSPEDMSYSEYERYRREQMKRKA